MKKSYFTLIKNGFVSCRRFDFRKDAESACELMNLLDPCWIVREIVCG